MSHFIFSGEKNKNKWVPISRYQLPSLKVLAARKVAEYFDPKKEMSVACAKKMAKLIAPEVSVQIALELAYKHAALLQPILNEDVETFNFKAIYHPSYSNLYEVRNGIRRGIESKRELFIPELKEENSDVLYYRMAVSEDKTLGVSRWPYTNFGLALALWDIKTGEKIKIITYKGDQDNKNSRLMPQCISNDNKTIFATNENFTLICGFSIETGLLSYEYKCKPLELLYVGKIYFGLNKGKTLQIRRISDSKQESTLPVYNFRSILTGERMFHSYEFSGNEKYTVTRTLKNYKQIKIFEIESGKCITTLAFPGEIYDAKFNVDGSILAIVFRNRVEFWNIKQQKRINCVYGENGTCTDVLYYDNDRIFFIHSWDESVCLDLDTNRSIIQKKVPEKFRAELREKYKFDRVSENLTRGIDATFDRKVLSLYLRLAKELPLTDLTALIALEHANQYYQPFDKDAWDLVQANDNVLLKTIFDARYEAITADIELEAAAEYAKKFKLSDNTLI